MTLKKGDFVTLDFTGRITETQDVFDTTVQQVARENGIQSSNMTYEPITVCIGQGHVLSGLDEALEGKEENTTFEVTLEAEQAFGKKRSDLIKLMPKKLFDKQKIRVAPGLHVTIDNMHGTIRSVSGNRVVVDFNHQLAGKDLTYEVTLKEKITDVRQQVEALVNMTLQAPATVKVEDDKATVTFPIDLPEELQQKLTETISENTSVKQVEYRKPEAKQNA